MHCAHWNGHVLGNVKCHMMMIEVLALRRNWRVPMRHVGLWAILVLESKLSEIRTKKYAW